MDGPDGEKARPDDESERETEKIVGEIISPGTFYSKKLLDQRGEAWLFLETEGHRSTYVVERGEQSWRFNLFFSAQAKFAREAQRAAANNRGAV